MSHDLYQEIILEEYQHPHNRAEMLDADVSTHELNASCGDEVTVFIKFDPSHERIAELSWVGQGCAISMATTSLLSEELKGKTLTEVAKLSQENLEEMLGIEEISPGRQKCLMLGLKAFQKAVQSTDKDKR